MEVDTAMLEKLILQWDPTASSDGADRDQAGRFIRASTRSDTLSAPNLSSPSAPGADPALTDQAIGNSKREKKIHEPYDDRGSGGDDDKFEDLMPKPKRKRVPNVRGLDFNDNHRLIDISSSSSNRDMMETGIYLLLLAF
ncbi:hypothetical protein M6B38_317065 [Iris pallida]|uniref:Uncharacterized protein n=1 Tax=Iris pallida TaxID=29817 RepID=A0AAX6HEH7_IRIPA|nr:hypothetical protein M6B38_317065 [Iris pallida]